MRVASNPGTRRLAVLAHGALDDPRYGKTALGLIRYCPDDVVALVDAEYLGQDSYEVPGSGRKLPVVGDVGASLKYQPSTLAIGIALPGGNLPQAWRQEILRALRSGLNVLNGLHDHLNDDLELAEAAQISGATITDLRNDNHGQTERRQRKPGAKVVTLVGSDCCVGKMTAALELMRACRDSGISAGFVATGQTGIMISGNGAALDALPGGEIASTVDNLVNQASHDSKWIFVEGQGSLLHPAYSGVALALLHGSRPDSMVLVHDPSRDTLLGYDLRIPALPDLVQIHEKAAGWIGSARVCAIALNTAKMTPFEASQAIRSATNQTGLPVDDPLRPGGAPQLWAAVRASAA